jgi:two-component system, NtrC family, response regulator
MANKTVIIVDDDPQITSTLGDLLTQAELNVKLANTYDEGLTAVKAGGIDIAIVDLMLADRNGMDLIREIKALPNPPVIMVLTNSLKSEDVAEAMEEGITTFLQKADHDPDDIVRTILQRVRS